MAADRRGAALLLLALILLIPASVEAKKQKTDEEPVDPDKPIFGLMPSISFNPDDGLGLGVYGDVKKPAREGEARRYRWMIGGVARIWLKPPQVGWGIYAGHSWFPWVDGRTEFAFTLSSFGRPWDWWFGAGQDSVRDRRFQRGADPVKDYYNRFGSFTLRTDAHVFRNVLGPLQAFAGVGVTGTTVVPHEDTLLQQQIAAGAIDGAKGGVDVSFDLGLRIDTRDNRVDPALGGLLMAYAQLHLGPERPWNRLMFDLRGYVGPPGGPIVLAGEILLQASLGPIPFYELGVLGGVEAEARTLTGVNGLRGLDRGRIRGPLLGLGHVELRFRPPGFRLFKGFFLRLVPALWADAVRVDQIPILGEGPPVQPALGWGCRFVINEVTVARFDMGTGPEAMLAADGATTRWPIAIYGTVNHSF